MRQMIIRADDVGYTDVCNIGAFTAIDGGLVTNADVMLDCPGTEDALRRLRNYPWLSIGWHGHMWGGPVLGADKVPTLVDHEGEFEGRFRTDLFTSDEVSFDEAYAELSAQIERCIDILGKAPDVCEPPKDTNYGRAFKKVADEHGIVYGFATREGSDSRSLAKIEAGRARGEEWAISYPPQPHPPVPVFEKWADRKIFILDGGLPYMDLLTDSVSDVEKYYDPVLYYTEDRGGILKYPDGVTVQQAWHPGYVDYYVYRQGEHAKRARARQFVVGRTQDVAALCDPRLRNWIIENKIRLVNTRDAIFGTNDFQNHLRHIGSDLYMG